MLAYFMEVGSDGATADDVAEATGFSPLSVGAIVSRLFNVERRIVASGRERLTRGDHYATVYVFDPEGVPVATPTPVPRPSAGDLAGFHPAGGVGPCGVPQGRLGQFPGAGLAQVPGQAW